MYFKKHIIQKTVIQCTEFYSLKIFIQYDFFKSIRQSDQSRNNEDLLNKSRDVTTVATVQLQLRL